MVKGWLERSLLVCGAMVLAGCGSSLDRPRYPFAKNEKAATIIFQNFEEGDRMTMYNGSQSYEISPVDGSNTALVPAGKSISIGALVFRRFSGRSYWCVPAVGFAPEEGKFYGLTLFIEFPECRLEVDPCVSEDSPADPFAAASDRGGAGHDNSKAGAARTTISASIRHPASSGGASARR
ncbi:hypothetical protein [Sorangium sp. So ce1389]|uniref:hypothetical protein n=1 Tax=Sorangium sp. So ce1389 TaxID=3133336 RepID=UPI003F5DE49C